MDTNQTSSEELDVVGSAEMDVDFQNAQALTDQGQNDENHEQAETIISENGEDADIDDEVDVGSQEAIDNRQRVEIAKSRKKKSRGLHHRRKPKRVGQDWQLNKMLSKAKAEAKAQAEAAEIVIPDMEPFQLDFDDNAPNQEVENQPTVNDKIKPDIELPEQSKH